MSTWSDHDEQLLVRRVVTVLCGLALLSLPFLHIGLGATTPWLTAVHLVVLAGAFAALGRTRLSTAQVVVGCAVLLWVVSALRTAAIAPGTVSGSIEGVGLGTGMLWLAAGIGPAIFLVMDVRRALLATFGAFAAAVGVLVAVTGGQLDRVLAHPGVWQVLVATAVVLCASAAVAWLARRSADERRVALVLREERAVCTARLEADQRRRARLFSRTATELQLPMEELASSAGTLRAHVSREQAGEALARVEQLAGDLLDRVVQDIDGLVARIQDDVAPSPAPTTDEPGPGEHGGNGANGANGGNGANGANGENGAGVAEVAEVAATVLMTCGVVAMLAFDAWRTILLAADGVPDAQAVAVGANRTLVVLFLAVGVFVVRYRGHVGWWLSGLLLLAHPAVVLGLLGPVAREVLVVPYAAAWRMAALSSGMLAVLAWIIERRVQDRDALVAAASDEDARRAELERREEAADLAYAEAAHELKNPLAVIRGAAGTLAEHGDALPAPDAEKLRAALARAIERLDARLAVMREVADEGGGTGTGAHRPAVVTHEGPPRPVAAADVLLDALAAARPRLGKRPVDVDVRVTGDWTSVAPHAVEHVLENLLSNADKYGDSEGLVRLTAHREGREVVVEVTNRGGELTEADAARIFEPYWRAVTADDHADGTGIGLAVVARLVEQWGGRCWARSSAGSTRVGFTMPVTASVPAPTWQQLQDQLG